VEAVMGGIKDHPLLQPRGNPTPLQQWERDNCKWTWPMFLIYSAPVIAHLVFDHWLLISSVLMIWGIARSKGKLRKWLGIVLLGIVLWFNLGKRRANDGEEAICVLYWFVAGYVTWFMNGQDHNRKMETKDWEKED